MLDKKCFSITVTKKKVVDMFEFQNWCVNHKIAESCLCVCYPHWTCDLLSFSLHNVDIIFRTSIITIQAQRSPEVGPQLAMTSDKGTNYFSVGKQDAE